MDNNSAIAKFFYTDHYDENQKLYKLNWFQQITLEDVVLVENDRKVVIEKVSCRQTQLVGKIFINYDGHQEKTTTTVDGKFAKKYLVDGKTIYLDIKNETLTFTKSSICERD